MNNIKQKYRFTIITCTYNSEKYLEECIKSVKSQKFRDFEHIFIDANSSDHTVEFIKDYQSRNPGQVRLIQQEPKGISNAMNIGIQNATGEIIVHLHSDDYFYSDETLNIVSQKFKESNAKIVVGNCLYKKADGFHTIWPKNKLVLWVFFKLMSIYLFSRNGIPHPATFIKKEVFERNGMFLENLKVVMDYELWFRLLKKEKFVFINDFLSVYRAHGATVSEIQAKRGRAEIAELFEKYRKQYFLEFVVNIIIIRPLIYFKQIVKG